MEAAIPTALVHWITMLAGSPVLVHCHRKRSRICRVMVRLEWNSFAIACGLRGEGREDLKEFLEWAVVVHQIVAKGSFPTDFCSQDSSLFATSNLPSICRGDTIPRSL